MSDVFSKSNIFSTREIAFGIYALIILIYIIAHKNTRIDLIDLIKVACTKQLIIPFAIILVYAALFVLVLTYFPFWQWIYLKDIVIWVLFAGVPICFNAVNSDGGYFNNIVKDNFKFTTLIEFLVGTFTFNIIIELLLQPIIFFLVIMQTIATSKGKYKGAEKLLTLIIALTGILVLFFTFRNALISTEPDDIESLIVCFSLPIILSILYLPIAYLLAIYAKYEIIFIRLKSKMPNDKKVIRERHRKIFNVCKLSYKRLCILEKEYIGQMYVTMRDDEFDFIMYDLKTSFNYAKQ